MASLPRLMAGPHSAASCASRIFRQAQDEEPRIPSLTGTAPVLPLRPGQPARRTHDYRRQGTTDLFAALDVQTGTVIDRCTRRYRSVAFRALLDQVGANVPRDLDIHPVLDNAVTHETKRIHD